MRVSFSVRAIARACGRCIWESLELQGWLMYPVGSPPADVVAKWGNPELTRAVRAEQRTMRRADRAYQRAMELVSAHSDAVDALIAVSHPSDDD